MAADRQFSMKVKLSCTTLKKFRKEEMHWLSENVPPREKLPQDRKEKAPQMRRTQTPAI